MKLNQGSEFTLDLKTIGLIVGMVVSVSGTYFTLKADIDANKKGKLGFSYGIRTER